MASRSSHSHPQHASTPPSQRWSQHVTETSDAMDLSPDVFKKTDPAAIARSVKRSAETSHRRKSDPFRSAMSMLTFSMNRAGKNLGARQRGILQQAKEKLRALFHREQTPHRRAPAKKKKATVSRR